MMRAMLLKYSIALVVLGATPAFAGELACEPNPLLPRGDELRVNEGTAESQDAPNVAVADDGTFVVGWVNLVMFADLYLRRFGPDGAPLGPERSVIQSPQVGGGGALMIYARPALLALSAGQVRAAWSGNYWEQTAPTTWTNRDGIVGAHYAADGSAIRNEAPVTTWIGGQPGSAGIAALPFGAYAVIWSGAGNGDSNGTWMRLYGPSDEPMFDQRLASVTTADGQFSPAIASDRSGNFRVVWRGNGPGDAQGIFMRAFDGSGVAGSGEVRINTTTASTQLGPDIAMHANGRFAVAWMGNGPGDDWGVFARLYRRDGTPLTAELAVNLTTAGNQVNPSIAMLPDGGFIVAWTGSGAGDDAGVFVRRYNEHGMPQAGETLVNTTTVAGQIAPAVAVSNGGEAMIVWSGNGSGDNLGIFARVFERPERVYRNTFEPDDAGCQP